MFVSYFSQVPVPFDIAVERLEPVLGELGGWAHEAYRNGEKLRARIGMGKVAPMIAKTVVLETATPERGLDSLIIPVSWRATGAPMFFPMMRADLHLLRVSKDTTQIRLSGSYTVPLGSIGQIFDDALLHRIAEGTIENFVNRIAEALTTTRRE
ncbi:MAG: hypothetical protein GXP34_05005 [Actinobacteria bacterium]|nr:hypothetical protein [Actinomycetota bacterium]